MRLITGVVLLAATAAAQTFSGHSGWSFSDTLQTATDVLVADIVSGAAVDDGSRVSVKATLRIVRVLSGSTAPGATLPVTWTYRPSPIEGPNVTSKVPLVRGLWFLRKAEALQATAMLSSLGGFYLPAGAAPRYYSQTAPTPYKIACELAPVVEDLATRHAADLAPHTPQPPVHGVFPPWVETRTRFQALVMALEGLDRTATSEAYAYFSSLPDPNLKLVGIQGRLTTGDGGAYLDLEKNLAALAPVLNGGALPPGPMTGEVRGNLPAAHALGRLAIGETPGFDGNAAFLLGATRSPEVLPYLAVMLGSPNPGVRDSALGAFCPLLRDGPFWRPEMSDYCPNRSPLNDPNEEDRYLHFWNLWWQAHREEIAKTVTLPSVSAPARYNSVSISRMQPMEMPIEYRFQSLLGMTHGFEPPAVDPIAAQLTPEDRAIWRQVAAAVEAKLDAVQQKSEQMLNAARLAGTLPDVNQSRALDQENRAALKSGLDELHNRLSPAGWQVIDKFLTQMGGSMVGGMIAAPPAR